MTVQHSPAGTPADPFFAATSNGVEDSTLADLALSISVDHVESDVRTLLAQNEELERLGRAIVDSARRGDGFTSLLPTQRVNDLADCLTRIEQGRS